MLCEELIMTISVPNMEDVIANAKQADDLNHKDNKETKQG